MKNLLQRISENAINFERFDFSSVQTQTKWLGNDPAKKGAIDNAERRLGVQLPKDYIDFLLITNGFSAPNDIEPSFEKLDHIDYLRNVDMDIINAYEIEELKRSIIIGGLNEEQYFLLIPPQTPSSNWRYWKFANWHPGEYEFENLVDYFQSVLDFQDEN